MFATFLLLLLIPLFRANLLVLKSNVRKGPSCALWLAKQILQIKEAHSFFFFFSFLSLGASCRAVATPIKRSAWKFYSLKISFCNGLCASDVCPTTILGQSFCMDACPFYKERHWTQNHVTFKWQIQDLNASLLTTNASLSSTVTHLTPTPCDHT